MQTNTTTPDLTAATFEELAAAKGVDLTRELTTGFAARLIRRKAKQIVGKAHLTPSDRPEIEHVLTMRLLERLSKFDPEKAHWNAFVTVVIEKHIATVLESRRIKKGEHSQNIVSLSTPVKDEDGEMVELGRKVLPEHQGAVIGKFPRSDTDLIDLQHDVAAVLAKLPDDLRELCVQLKTRTLSDIAREMGVSRSTLFGNVMKLREIFDEAEMRSFL